MGQSEIKREHLRLIESDFPILEQMTKEIMQVILDSFKCEVLKEDNWPYRFRIDKNSIHFEFIFSQMGSITLRLNDSFRKNSPPIFYLSIGKYENGEYVWEDLNAIPISPTNTELIPAIEKSILVYESSLREIWTTP